MKLLSRAQLFATPWTVAYQAPPSVGFSRQEYWSGLPFPPPGDLPNPGIEPGSPALQADAVAFPEPPESTHYYMANPFMANRWGNSGNSDRLYFPWAPRSLQMVTAAMKLKDACSLEEKP